MILKNLRIITRFTEVLIRSGINIKEGLELSNNGLNKHPENGYWRHKYGLALHKAGNHVDALEILRKADEVMGYYNKDLAKGIKEVEEAIARSKNN